MGLVLSIDLEEHIFVGEVRITFYKQGGLFKLKFDGDRNIPISRGPKMSDKDKLLAKELRIIGRNKRKAEIDSTSGSK